MAWIAPGRYTIHFSTSVYFNRSASRQLRAVKAFEEENAWYVRSPHLAPHSRAVHSMSGHRASGRTNGTLFELQMCARMFAPRGAR